MQKDFETLIQLLDNLSAKYGVELHNMSVKRVFEYLDKPDREFLHDFMKYGGRSNGKTIH